MRETRDTPGEAHTWRGSWYVDTDHTSRPIVTDGQRGACPPFCIASANTRDTRLRLWHGCENLMAGLHINRRKIFAQVIAHDVAVVRAEAAGEMLA